jgi:putative transposase
MDFPDSVGTGVTIVRTPYRAPNANAIAERWIRSVRQECLDHLVIVGEAHLRRVLGVYVGFYNQLRPHHGLDQRTPATAPPPAHPGPVRCRTLLGDLLRSDDRAAA